MQNEYLEHVNYLWYSVSLAILVIWLWRRGWRFQPLDFVRGPRPGFALFDVLLILLGYFISSLTVSSLFAFDTNTVTTRPVLYFGALLGKQFFISFLILVLVWRRYAGGLTVFGFRFRNSVQTVVRGTGCFIATTGLTLFVLEITQILCLYFHYPDVQQHTILTLLSQNPPGLNKLLMVATAAIGAPLQEELLFRGILQTYFVSVFLRMLREVKASPSDLDTEDHISVSARWLGIVVVSALFALMHLPNWQHVPALFVLGMYLGYSYERYGNLLIPFFVHCMFNVLPLAIMMW